MRLRFVPKPDRDSGPLRDGSIDLETGVVGKANRVQVADTKQQLSSYIDLTGVIGGVKRSVRLQLDNNWINEYIARQAPPHG